MREAGNKIIDLKIQKKKKKIDDRLLLFVLVYLLVDLREIMSSLICLRSECSTYEDVKKVYSEIEREDEKNQLAVGKR